MSELQQHLFLVVSIACIITCIINLGFVAALYFNARSLNKSSRESLKELYGIMKKIEGLTSGKREQILRQYDKIVQDLKLRLPTVIAAQASDSIFETESSLLQNLVAIDPSIKDEERKEHLNELIRSMEKLQETLSSLVSETVQKALEDARAEIASDEKTII
ncbi:MAG: hypothetical protein GYA55_04150 [SAR324 cluster bacterium]|uniref:Uncharacterized protein n=1 Tax=SAR324 cluster bacterium TaxID=2024889 RepID=A0A7X9IIS0_9DELT|nr:hypothetical protein [SAR324 cluster bacterium]